MGSGYKFLKYLKEKIGWDTWENWHPHTQTVVKLFPLILILFAIPITLNSLQQQQNLKQEASTTNLITSLVVNDSNSSAWSVQNNLQTGNQEFGDRNYAFTSIPGSLVGTTWIRTANSSKSSNATPLVSFNISAPVTVYISIDNRITNLPSWLDSSWKNTGMIIVNNESSPITSTLYSKIFQAGTISLNPLNTDKDNYVIFLGKSFPLSVSNLKVYDPTNASNWSTQYSNFAPGILQFGDRTYLLTQVPNILKGTTWIRTANSSKSSTNNPLVTFDISEASTVYVSVYNNMNPLPSFLSDGTWKNTGLTITNNEKYPGTFNLYSKSFPAGTVSLGYFNATYSMYSVVLVGDDSIKPVWVSSLASPTPTQAPALTPTPTPTWVFCANEGQTCTFNGTKQIRYGANGSYYYGTFTSSASCSNSTFGDPLITIVKHCDYSDTLGISSPTPTPLKPTYSPTPTPASNLKTVTVNSVSGIISALRDNTNDVIVVKNGTYHVSAASNQASDSLWITDMGRTRPVTVKAETTGGVTFDGGGTTYFGCMSFENGAHDQVWDGFKCANGEATETGIITFGGYPTLTAPYNITMRNINILSSCTGNSFSTTSPATMHAFYISQAPGGGPHNLLFEDITIDGRGGLASAFHFYHSDKTNNILNGQNITVRRLHVTGTQQAIILWDPTLYNILFEYVDITGALSYGVRYETTGAQGIVFNHINTYSSGLKGFYSSQGDSPSGVTISSSTFN